ncbi:MULTISPECIES: propane 2-monooxygenase effector subunit MimD [unclassified Blastococcus]
MSTTATTEFGAVNKTSSNRAGITLMNDQVGHVIAEVMKDKAGVTVTYLPSMIRVDAVDRVVFDYDELAEALGEEPGSFTSADLEESMSTHYGRMVHEDGSTIMFANPEDAAEYLGFDLTPAVTSDIPAARASTD